jgi:hypothetical protein
MSIHTRIEADPQPTLAQRLRFIDLTFECFNAAKAEAVSSLRDGAAARLHPDGLQSTFAGEQS